MQLYNRISLPKIRYIIYSHKFTWVVGIRQAETKVTKTTNIKIHSTVNSFNINISCLVLSHITQNIPEVRLNVSHLNIPKVKLADPQFNIPSAIDMLIGNEHFWNLMLDGHIRLTHKGPVIQKTQLDWILAGCLPRAIIKTSLCNYTSIRLLEKNVNKFWEVDSFEHKQHITSKLSQLCENIFNETQKDVL